MKYDILKWLNDISKINNNGDTYAHVSYKRVENGKTVEEYEQNYLNGEPVEENKQVCGCNKEYQALTDENKELKGRVYDLEKRSNKLEEENENLRYENKRLEEKLDEKTKYIENIKKTPMCGGFMISEEDVKKGNIGEMFRQAGEYMQNVLNGRMGM